MSRRAIRTDVLESRWGRLRLQVWLPLAAVALGLSLASGLAAAPQGAEPEAPAAVPAATAESPSIVIDLSQDQLRGGSIPVGKTSFLLENAIPGVTYEIHYSLAPDTWLSIAPLKATWTDVRKISLGEAGPHDTEMSIVACERLQVLLQGVLTADEKKIAGLRREVEIQAPACTGSPELAAAVTAFQRGVVRRFPGSGGIAVAAGDTLELEISRSDKNPETKTKEWSAKFTAPRPPDQWESTFGFIFMPNDDKLYFSKATSDANKFQITKKDDRGGYEFAPSYMFTWIPREWQSSKPGRWFRGLGAGLAWDGSDPSVLVGGVLGLARNVALTGGLAIRKVARLAGEYDEDELPEVATQLSEDQLRKDVYEPTFFLGLSMRFGSSPFPQASNPGTAPASNGDGESASDADKSKKKKGDDGSNGGGEN